MSWLKEKKEAERVKWLRKRGVSEGTARQNPFEGMNPDLVEQAALYRAKMIETGVLKSEPKRKR